ncbi:MAG: oxygen-dependent coproporphyrinogen oxidase [Acidobacteriota bacterium]
MENQQPLKERAQNFFSNLQDEICQALESLDGKAGFREDLWQREGGGGGRTRVLEQGAVFEKAGVNFSAVHGNFPEAFAATMPVGSGTQFFATGISLVLHPYNPFAPTVHANFRYLERGSGGWFGGGADLTPAYPYREDVIHFHQTLKAACDPFDATYYPRFKKWCDDYFTIKYRQEMRGVGGIFFDYLTPEQENRDREFLFAFQQAVGRAFLPAYLPIVERRKDEAYSERERHFQLIRRGRYVEFNLVYDRGTKFGLETGGRIESILMSLPAEARWVYDYQPEPASREAEALKYFQPHDWLTT